MTTVAFYAALHAVAALLAHDGVTADSHAARNAALRRVRRYEQIERHYIPLYFDSQDARYSADPSKWTPAGRLQREIVEGRLYPIERSVQKLIGRDLQLGPVRVRT